jgi:uncharacterized protein (TIGR03067 family)
MVVAGFLVAAVGLVTAADTAKEEAIKQDRAQYEGAWRVSSLEVNGNKAQEADARKIVVLNHADTWTITVGGQEVARGTSKIDPTQKPKTIDFVPSTGAGVGKTFLGIYEIAGDCRKLCYAAPGKARPAEFASKPGSEQVFVVFQREKK